MIPWRSGTGTVIRTNLTKTWVQNSISEECKIMQEGFSLAFRKRVSETLRNRFCFRKFLFMFPVSGSPPPTYFLPFFDRDLKKSPAKKNIIISTSFLGQGHKGMEDDNVLVHEAARIVE